MASLQEFNMSHKVEDAINKAHTVSKNAYNDILGNVSRNLAQHTYSGSFVGIDVIGLQALKRALEDYITSIQNIIDRFNEEGDLSVAFAGAPLGAAKEFVKAMKSMLTAYVSSMRMEKKELDEAMENYSNAGVKIRSAVESDVNSLRSSARSINID